MLGSFHNIFWQLAEEHSAARIIPRCPLSSRYKDLSNGITTTVVVIPLGLTISVGSGFGSDTSSPKSVSLHIGEANLTPLLSQWSCPLKGGEVCLLTRSHWERGRPARGIPPKHISLRHNGFIFPFLCRRDSPPPPFGVLPLT